VDACEESQVVRGRLDEIVEKGAPALAREARLLSDQWTARPGDGAVAERAALLFDAYLNDPYLTRYSDPPS
jgi:hypothetical protein